MTRLVLGLLFVVVLLGWLLISGSETQISSSKSVIQENSPVSASGQILSGKSPVSSIPSLEIQSISSPTGDRSIDVQTGAKPVFTPNTTLTFSTTTTSSGTTSSTRFSGSTAGLFDPGSGPSVGGGGGPIREIAIPVPAGAKVPALFQDDTPKPLQQMKALDRIASEFEQNVSEIPAGMTQEDVWEAARLIADERYITLFGYQAYNQYHIKAAKEALKEKRARSNATGP
jgi:hypothetical protein